MNSEDLSAFDREHIWHPYTSLKNPLPSHEVTSAEGVHLNLRDGRKLVDGMSSWWCAIHGYRVPELDQAVAEQLENMAHVMFGGLTHSPAVELAQSLIDISPEGLQKLFFADSGSVAVEVAIKMALQYWQAKGYNTRTKLLSPRFGYHGDTFGAMSVSDPENGMHHLFSDMLAQHYFVSAPPQGFDRLIEDQDMQELEQQLDDKQEHIAAVILEPVIQGAGGMRIYSPDYLARVKAFCDRYEVLLILDEIATGFGRTGKMFACEHAAIEPDIMCVGKALTGGYMSLAATLCSENVSTGIAEDGSGVLMHGPTFMANPLACKVATASIDLLLKSPWQSRIRHIEQTMREGLQNCLNYPSVVDVRVLGGVGIVELNRTVDVADAQKYFIEQGVWIRPFRNLIYLMPPYIIEAREIERLCNAIDGFIGNHHTSP